MANRILCLNFGSTSTKIAAFSDEEKIFSKSWSAGDGEYPDHFEDLAEHEAFATDLIEKELKKHGLTFEDFDIFSARGGAQVFIESGAYGINDIMLEDTYKFGGEKGHPGKLATRICGKLGKKFSKPAYIINGPSVDEFQDVARMTGFKDLYRQSRIHALNQKEIGHRYAKETGRKYEDLNLIICHIGGGMSITAHRKGLMVDSNDIIEGEGPMTATRSGAIPSAPLVRMCYSGKYTEHEMLSHITKTGGLTDHLGTDDLRKVEQKIKDGDQYAKMVLDSMIYQIAKTAGSMAVVLKGQVDRILLTGGMAHSEYLVSSLKDYLGWIADFTVYPGEFEMEALAAGALRVARGEETAKEYTGKDVWDGFHF